MAPRSTPSGPETLLHLDIAWWDLCGPCAEAENSPPAINAANATPDAFTRHLAAAQGWLELGSPQEAWEELEQIKPGRHADTPGLGPEG